MEATACQPEGRSLGALAADVGLAKPTAHRILNALAKLGYIERMGSGVYRQTSQVRRLLNGRGDERLLAAARPILRRLHEQTRETVNLGVLRHGRVLYLEVLESPLPLRRVASANTIDPFHSTALGRAIVSHLSDEQRDLLLRSISPERRTPQTVIDPDELRRVLDEARERGFAIEENQTDLGVTCIAAPVFEADSVVAAISISLPSVRAHEAARGELIDAIRAAAAELTRRLDAQAVDGSEPAGDDGIANVRLRTG